MKAEYSLTPPLGKPSGILGQTRFCTIQRVRQAGLPLPDGQSHFDQGGSAESLAVGSA